MGYTRDQLEAMGAKPVTQPVQATGQSPVAPQASTTPKRKYTLAELQQMGAKPAQQQAPAPVKQDGLLATLIKDPIETLLVKPADRFAEAVGRTGILGQNIKRGYEEMADNGESRTFAGIEVEPQKAFGAGGGKQILGEAAKTASYLYSGGKAPQPVSKLLQGKYAQGAMQGANIGGVSGALYGAGEELQNTDSTLGSVGTKALQGGGIGMVGGAVLGGGAPLAVKGAGVLAREGLGVSTGVGGGVIREGLSAASQGGKQAEAFRNALRGNVSPDEIVDEARSALGQIITNRTTEYRNQLAKVATNTKVFDDISPVVTKFNKMLEDYGVTFDKNGLPDFTRSPGLGRYEKDLTNISGVLANWGTKEGDNTIVGIDKLKQVLDDFRIGSSDSRKFDSFVTALRNETKNIIKNEPNYNKMVSDYENSTGLIKEIQRGLSLGDKAQADTAFRKLTSVLRTNNELRKQLIDEISEISGGTLVPKIAGQQLSETLPRGLMKPLGGVVTGGALVTGNIIPVLFAALATSPRLVGEILSIHGYSAAQIKRLLQIIAPQGLRMPGTSDGVPPKNQPRSKIPPTMMADQKAPTQQSQSGAELSSSKLKTNTAAAKASMSAGKLLSDISTGLSQSKTTVKLPKNSKTGTKNMFGAAGGAAGAEDTDGDGIADNVDPLKAGLGMAIGSIATRKISPEAFKNFTDLSTKLLGKLEGRSTVSRQFIAEMMKSPDVKKAEREIFERVLDDMTNKNLSKAGGNAYAQVIADVKDGVQNTGKQLMDEAGKTPINVKDFANKVKTELVPLKVKTSDRYRAGADGYGEDDIVSEGAFTPKYEGVSLPQELRGDVADYRENIYESPIKNQAGSVHFDKYSVPNYFAHTRLEEMAPSYMPGKGKVERTIEVQSDLMQKDRLEDEMAKSKLDIAENSARDRSNRELVRKEEALSNEQVKLIRTNFRTPSQEQRLKDIQEELQTIETQKRQPATSQREAELSKLEPYRNDWAPRIIREDIKDAAKRGVNTKLYPTGETAMKIEGLGDTSTWIVPIGEASRSGALTEDLLRTGMNISRDRGERWIITDVLGDGKFKAVPKQRVDQLKYGKASEEDTKRILENVTETFDISGKVDTENPIYKFYESTVGKYLKNKYGAKLVTDDNGVTWWEIDLTKDHARLPVEAFALAPIGISLADRSKEKK